MKGLVVYKMSGSGNDFVMVDGRSTSWTNWGPAEIQKLCNRRDGVGADGLVVLERGSVPGAVRFHYYNADGTKPGLCGNASLCATRLAARLELAPGSGMTLETDVGAIEARALDGPGERAEMVMPELSEITTPEIELAPGEQAIHHVVVGVPHLVVELDGSGLESIDPTIRGRYLRSHPAVLPDGANVNFVASNGAEWSMRTYERGVEAETSACATGATAAAAILAHRSKTNLPCSMITWSNHRLDVARRARNGSRKLMLAGEGRLVYKAVLT